MYIFNEEHLLFEKKGRFQFVKPNYSLQLLLYTMYLAHGSVSGF